MEQLRAPLLKPARLLLPLLAALLVSGAAGAGDGGFSPKLSGSLAFELQNDFDIIMRFWDSPKPTIAAVHTYCLGSAMEMAVACDITVAAEDCRFGAPEVKFGSGIVSLILPWVIGVKQAKELLLTGADDVSAERAGRHDSLRICPTVAECLTLSGDDLAVDGVLLIAEHGDYEKNEIGQVLWPRYEFFQQMEAVFRACGRSVPVFVDKHLSWNWDWARDMFDVSRELGFPLMAGSSLPARIVGLDYAESMCQVAARKAHHAGFGSIRVGVFEMSEVGWVLQRLYV